MVSKTMAVILAILEESGTPIHRTKLVKLTYLADNLFYEHFGMTITGLGYMWDDFGPNAISNAIVKESGKLADAEFACLKVGTSMYGSENYIYSIGPKRFEIPENLLSPLERQVIRDTVERYRNYSVTSIVSASKKTKPFKDALQYTVLKMTKSIEYQDLLDAVKLNTDFMAGIKEGLKASAESEGMRLQEVKQKYGL